jgi:hypothetical protein
MTQMNMINADNTGISKKALANSGWMEIINNRRSMNMINTDNKAIGGSKEIINNQCHLRSI